MWTRIPMHCAAVALLCLHCMDPARPPGVVDSPELAASELHHEPLLAGPEGLEPERVARLPAEVVGARFDYTARAGDSLHSVASRFGLEVPVLARANGLEPDAKLDLGQVLRVANLHIVPERLDEGILVNVPQRMLFLFRAGKVAAAHPVGLGRPDWPTPTGTYRVETRERDKIWYVPPSIQEEMRAAGKPVVTRVPPGAENPLGGYWLGLTETTCGIHATLAPTSIYDFRSHGCIRVHLDDMEALFDTARIGEEVRIIYRPVLLAEMPDGRILLEAHRDAYGLRDMPIEKVRALVAVQGLADAVDWDRVGALLQNRQGTALSIGRDAETQGG